MPTDQELISEILNDPVLRGYKDLGLKHNSEIQELLNSPYTNGYVPIPSKALLTWSAQNGRYHKIKDGTINISNTIRAICEIVIIMIQRDDTELDLRNPTHMALLNVLNTTSPKIISDTDKTDLLNLCTKQISRSYELWGEETSRNQIRRVRPEIEKMI